MFIAALLIYLLERKFVSFQDDGTAPAAWACLILLAIELLIEGRLLATLIS